MMGNSDLRSELLRCELVALEVEGYDPRPE